MYDTSMYSDGWLSYGFDSYLSRHQRPKLSVLKPLMFGTPIPKTITGDSLNPHIVDAHRWFIMNKSHQHRYRRGNQNFHLISPSRQKEYIYNHFNLSLKEAEGIEELNENRTRDFQTAEDEAFWVVGISYAEKEWFTKYAQNFSHMSFEELESYQKTLRRYMKGLVLNSNRFQVINGDTYQILAHIVLRLPEKKTYSKTIHDFEAYHSYLQIIKNYPQVLVNKLFREVEDIQLSTLVKKMVNLNIPFNSIIETIDTPYEWLAEIYSQR